MGCGSRRIRPKVSWSMSPPHTPFRYKVLLGLHSGSQERWHQNLCLPSKSLPSLKWCWILGCSLPGPAAPLTTGGTLKTAPTGPISTEVLIALRWQGGRVYLCNILHTQNSGRHGYGMSRMTIKFIIQMGTPLKGKSTLLIIISGQQV